MVKQDFKLEIPLKKSYTDDTGEYHIAFCISTTEKDAYGDILTENALNSMLIQAKNININSSHQNDLNSLIGPVKDAWIEKEDDITYLWVDVLVRKEWEETIKDLIKTGIALGGSIEGNTVSFTYTDKGDMLIDDMRLYGAALTTIPANNATLGTVTNVEAGCPGSLCRQLSKQLNKNMEVDKLTKEEETKENGFKKENEDVDKNTLCKLMEMVSEKVDTICDKLNGETDPKESKKDDEDDDDGGEELKKSKQKEENLKLEKKLSMLKEENTKLKSELIEKEEKNLIKKAIMLNKKLDSKTKLITKELVLDEIKQLSNDEMGLEQIKTYIHSMELALKKIPQGDKPHLDTDTFEKGENKLQERMLEKNRILNEMGREE